MCQRAVYLASGGQLDSRGRPTGKGANPVIAQQATRIVQNQYNAAQDAAKRDAATSHPRTGPTNPTGMSPSNPCPKLATDCQPCSWNPIITECFNLNYNYNKDYFTSLTTNPRDTGVVECGPRPTISGLISCAVAPQPQAIAAAPGNETGSGNPGAGGADQGPPQPSRDIPGTAGRASRRRRRRPQLGRFRPCGSRRNVPKARLGLRGLGSGAARPGEQQGENRRHRGRRHRGRPKPGQTPGPSRSED